MIKWSKKLFHFIHEYYLWMTSYYVKKDKTIWVFGAIRGQKYLDNARYLFEYIHESTKIEAIWISKNKNIVKELQEEGFNAFYEHSDEALYYARRAKVAVITHRGNRKGGDLPFYLFSKKTEIIQLWHGIGLKKMAFDDKVFSFQHNEDCLKWRIKALIKKVFFPYFNYVNKPSMILALADNTREIFSKAFRIPKEKVYITGYPRNDILLKNQSVKKKESKKKKVIYMPTFRGSVNSDFDLFLQYGFNVEKIDDFLLKENMQLDIKLHPFNQPSPKLIKKLELSKNIFFLDHDAIYEIISEYNILITDYSSIYFDYLLLNRPVIFAPFDQETYLKQDREFYFDYEEVTPGPKAMNWDEVMESLKIFNKNPQAYSEERKIIKDRFHTYQDNKSTQRVYEAILAIIK